MRNPRLSATPSDQERRVCLSIAWLVVIGFIGFLGWLGWDTSRNRGYEFGYYGEFNRVAHALATIPEVTVVRSWHNADLTLEEFGFDLMVSGQSIDLDFGETDPIRTMKREDAVGALKSRIASRVASSR